MSINPLQLIIYVVLWRIIILLIFYEQEEINLKFQLRHFDSLNLMYLIIGSYKLFLMAELCRGLIVTKKLKT
jgi:hypothetical protein